MPEWILILVKFNLSLAVVWLFYSVFLRKITFYGWNRIYLLAYSTACLVIPFININPWLSSGSVANHHLIESFPSVTHWVSPVTRNFPAADDSRPGYSFWMASLLVAGSLVMGIRLCLMYISLLRISRNSKLLVSEPVSIYETPGKIVPFSFGKKIFIHPSSLPEGELETIIRHEFIHVKQKHSMDIIFSEFICVIAWYNPFAWGIRHAIRQNLEFIADQQVLTHGADRRSYQWLLLKVTGHAPIAISNQFNLSFLKNRLIMMNKNKSAKTQLLKFLLMLPILVILLMAFRSAGDSIFPAIIKEALHPGLHVALADTLPPAPPPPVPVVEAPARPPVVTAAPRVAPVPPVIQKGNVKNININNNNRANVELKNGKKEYYNLNNAAEKKAFEKKYGMPAPPPPIVESEIVIANEEAVALPETEVAISEAPQAKVAPVIATAPMVKVTTRAKPVQAVAPMPAIEDESIELEGEMLLNLNAHSTQADIDRQVSKIKSKGYIIEISNVVFMNGRLTMIEGFLSSKKKKNHFRAADFKELYFTESDDKSDDSGFRFYIVKGQLSVN